MALRSPDVDEVREYRPCWEPDEVCQVLDGLERLATRANRFVLQRRRCDRKPYNAAVMVSQNRKVRFQDGSRAMMQVIARNLSRSGLGLLAPMFFEPEVPCREAPMLRATNIFREGAVLEIGLKKPTGALLWLYGTIIRARTVQHDFLDIGVRFNAKINVVEELEME